MPKLWKETIEAHRAEVRDAVLDAAAELVAEHGPLAVTMSEIAERAEIGRATLYKYFPDVESILRAWHARQIGAHLEHISEIAARRGDADERLEAVLGAYASILFESHRNDPALVAFLHARADLTAPERHVRDVLRNVLSAAIRAGDVRDDVPADELAAFCLHALGGASRLRSTRAVRRLVAVTLAGLRRST